MMQFSGQNKKGFTFIEVILVIAILAIIAGAGLSLLNNSGSDFNIDSAARRIASDINYARSFAISSGKKINIVFNYVNERYSIDDGSTFIKHPLRKDDFIVTFTDKFGLKDVDLYQVVINGGGSTLSFKTDGTVNGGLVEIRCAGKSKKIAINQSNGAVSIQ